jgi:lipoprotein-anchoring transpeptidase ErfK/SrfK
MGAAVLLSGAVALLLTACSGSSAPATKTVTATASSSASAPAGASSSAPVSSSAPASSTAPAAKTVHISTINDDGASYGVGMPVIVYFASKITDAKAWQAATKVTVNDKPVVADWFFEPSSAGHGPLEAHLRTEAYWPAHSKIHVQFPPKGTSLGTGLQSDGKLSSLDFSTGARNIAIVDDSTNMITVTSDGKQKFKMPVSLGANKTPTFSGTKVIMEKLPTVCMTDVDHTYHECGIKWDERLTYSGEYLHAAPWNTYNIDHGINSSNGCTNLHPDDAKTLYDFLEVGDVVQYPNANGPAMQLGSGYGDWNVSWTQWQGGGAVSTTT